MGVDSILGYNLSVQTKNFTKRITLGATGANQTQGLSESEKLENFKKEIWKEIDSMSWGSNISVQITDSAFEKMMVDKEFKNKMMNIIREDARGSNMMCGGTLINIDENGYRFIWRKPDGSLQPARGQARIPSTTDIFELLALASKNGWLKK